MPNKTCTDCRWCLKLFPTQKEIKAGLETVHVYCIHKRSLSQSAGSTIPSLVSVSRGHKGFCGKQGDYWELSPEEEYVPFGMAPKPKTPGDVVVKPGAGKLRVKTKEPRAAGTTTEGYRKPRKLYDIA